jgi:hypothetical protein
LYQIGARWYDAVLNRWAQPDTLIPDWYDPQSLNRYAYGLNNPVKYTDPTGHCTQLEDDPEGLCVRTEDEDTEDEEGETDPETIVVVHGGSEFTNGIEVAIANYLLTGDERWLDAIPQAQGIRSGLLNRSINNVLASLSVAGTSGGVQVPIDAAWAMLGVAAASPGRDELGLRPGGMNGSLDHREGVRAALREVAEQYRGGDFTIQTNKSIKSALGIDRRPDISVWLGKELQSIVEVARVRPSGSLVSREAGKLAQYTQAGIDFRFWILK